MSHFIAPDTGTQYPLFGSPESFDALANRVDVPVLGRVPLEMHVSTGGDRGVPEVIRPVLPGAPGVGAASKQVFLDMARQTWQSIPK